MQIMFDKATLENKTLWEQTYVDRWFDFRPPQLGLTAEGIMGKYSVRIRASIMETMLILHYALVEGLNCGTVRFPV